MKWVVFITSSNHILFSQKFHQCHIEYILIMETHIVNFIKYFPPYYICDSWNKRFEIIRDNSLIFSVDLFVFFSSLVFLTRPAFGLFLATACCCCLTRSGCLFPLIFRGCWVRWWWWPVPLCCSLTPGGELVVVVVVVGADGWLRLGSWGRDWP